MRFENSWPPFWQIWIIFAHLMLWIASARHNVKWVKMSIKNLSAKGLMLITRVYTTLIRPTPFTCMFIAARRSCELSSLLINKQVGLLYTISLRSWLFSSLNWEVNVMFNIKMGFPFLIVTNASFITILSSSVHYTMVHGLLPPEYTITRV